MMGEIIEEPYRVSLIGFRGSVEDRCYGEVGKKLMDRLWVEVGRLNIATRGINHWVYFDDGSMYAGVSPEDPATDTEPLETIEIVMNRFLRYVHKGSYEQLAEVWKALFADLESRGETPRFPSLEVYAHWDREPEKCETKILIGL